MTGLKNNLKQLTDKNAQLVKGYIKLLVDVLILRVGHFINFVTIC